MDFKLHSLVFGTTVVADMTIDTIIMFRVHTAVRVGVLI